MTALSSSSPAQSLEPDRTAQEEYAKVRKLAEFVRTELTGRLERAVQALGDPFLVRAKIAESRIKDLTSLHRKAQLRGWSTVEAFARTEDLVGFRVVCNNIQDIRRVARLLTESLRSDGHRVRRLDYLSRPKKDGYRAIHLNFSVPAALGSASADVSCEIQIRSLLQDSWARLSRVEVYSGEFAPPNAIANRMQKLAKKLAEADAIAESIRRDIARPRRGRAAIGGQPLNSSAAAFLYKAKWGVDPPGYVVQSVMHELGGQALRTDGFDSALQDDQLIEKLKTAYSEGSGRYEFEAEPYHLFRWIARSAIRGTGAAIREARRDGQAAAREIDVIGRAEALSDAPAVTDMLDALEYAHKDEDPEGTLTRWADGLDVSRSCIFCGTSIVDPEEFGEAAVRHYKIRGKNADEIRERLAESVRSSALEQGSFDNSSMCSYCSYVLSKD
jgi:ppGpp synthetase/RelA/SpoT-type nucleotidyltranferase